MPNGNTAGAERQYRAMDGAVPNRDTEGANRRDYSLDGTPTDDVARKVPALHDLRALRAQTVRELDISGKDGAYLPSWEDLREGWYDERLEEA